MSELLKMCEYFFGTRDFYEVLKIQRTARGKKIKKAYHRLSLLVHPDRVAEDKKFEATEKFKILGKIHTILSDKNKRAVYDESGEFDEDSDAIFNWLNYWRSLFKEITHDDINKYEQKYIGSEEEKNDVKRAYLRSKGNMGLFLKYILFSNCDHKPRYIEIVKEMIDSGEVPEYKSFTEEPKKKKEQRRKKWKKQKAKWEKQKAKWEKQKAKAASIDKEELKKAIQETQAKREKIMCDYFAELEAQYGRKSAEENPPAKRTKSKK